MQTDEKTLKKMYSYAKEYYEGEDMDIYELKRFYNDFAEEFGLDIAFGVDGNEYGGDDEIYCYIHVNNIGSIVFNWGVNWYTDGSLYKDVVNYLLELQEEGEQIEKKVLNPKQEQKGSTT